MPRTGISLLGALFAAGAVAQEQPPGFTERVEVNVRTILVVVTDSKGKPLSRPLAPDEVEVLLDGVPAKVLGVDSIRTPAAVRSVASPASAPTPPSASVSGPIETIPQILYLDASLLQNRGVKRVAEAVGKNLTSILSRGPLEIVVADPEPTVVLSSTTEARPVRAWLDEAPAKFTGRARLADVRRDYLRARNDETRSTPNVKVRLARVRVAAQEEIRLVEQSLERLEKWAAGTHVRPPTVLYLANDGFDVNPVEFYKNLSDPFSGGVTSEEQTELAQMRMEFDPAIPRIVARLSHALANQGITTIALAAGGSEATFSSDAATMGKRSASDFHSALASPATFLFVRPLDPLRQIAEETGGEVVTQENNFAAALDRLSHAVAITYRMDRPPDGRPHRLEVRTIRPGVVLRAVRSIIEGSDKLAVAAQSAVQALENAPAASTLPVDVQVDLLEVKPDNRRVGEMHVSVDLSSILEALEKVGPGRMRVTVAVRASGKQPFVHHEEVDLAREGPGADWTYVVPLEWPGEASRVAVTVEELKTGTRGAAAADLPLPNGK
jgi:hypothetical protein